MASSSEDEDSVRRSLREHYRKNPHDYGANEWRREPSNEKVVLREQAGSQKVFLRQSSNSSSGSDCYYAAKSSHGPKSSSESDAVDGCRGHKRSSGGPQDARGRKLIGGESPGRIRKSQLPRSAEDEDIRRNLQDGVNVMREFGWIYPPPSSTNSSRDDAMKGFKLFVSGVTRLSTVAGRLEPEQADKYAANLTEDMEAQWPDVLHFLVTMGLQKKAYASQIKFVAAKLSAFSPTFSAAAQFKDFNSLESATEGGSVMSALTTLSSIGEFSTHEADLEMETQEAVVAKRGWVRARVYNRDDESGMKPIGRISDGTLVRVLDDENGEYAKVEVPCWIKRKYLQMDLGNGP